MTIIANSRFLPQSLRVVLILAIVLLYAYWLGGTVAAQVVFHEDFKGHEPGAVPAGWEIGIVGGDDGSTVGRFEVVEDSTAPSGRALRMQRHGPREVGIVAPIWDSAAREATTMAIEFKVRSVQGAMNAYVRVPPPASRPALHWAVRNGELHYHRVANKLADLQDGWNIVRLVADVKANEVYVYLNDATEPVGGPFPFRDKPSSWGTQSRFRFVLSANEADIYLTDLKVRIVDNDSNLEAYNDPQAIEEVLSGQRDEAIASWWGFDPEDSTEFLQAAIDSGVSKLIIPNMGQDWVVRPLYLRSNLELVFEEGVVVSAKRGEFLSTSASLFTAQDVENLVLKGYGATLRMHKDDYTQPPYRSGEWRMGISLRGSKNVQILGLTIRDTGGDGIYLGRGTSKPYNENIVIRDVVADNNHRQGISVVTAKDLLIENSIFKNTAGTPPMAGIDFEPNRDDEKLENIIVRNSVFDSNTAYGITVNLQRLSRDADDVSILMEDILIRGSTYGAMIRTYGAEGQQPGGEIVLRNCIIEGSTYNGIRVVSRTRDPASDPFQVRFENCVVHDVVPEPRLYEGVTSRSVPVSFEGDTWLGAVHFDNVVVADEMDRPVFYAAIREEIDQSQAAYLQEVSGQIHVVNSHGASVHIGENASQVALTAVPKESVVIDYGGIISLPEYGDAPIHMRVEPTVRVSNLKSPMYPLVEIRGFFSPEFELLNLDEGELEHVEILLNGSQIFVGEGLPTPGSIKIDTLELPNGRHEIMVTARTGAGDVLGTRAHFVTQNFSHLVDAMEGPRQAGWFGTVYNPIAVDQSDGWQYVTGNPEDFFGDNNRKERAKNTMEYIVWETPGLWDFSFDLFTKNEFIGDVVTVEGSADQQAWYTMDYQIEETGTSPAGWTRLTVRGVGPRENDDGSPVNFVRLTMKESALERALQLGQAFFRMLR